VTNSSRKIGISIALLLPALVVAGGLAFILSSLDNGSGPGIEVGATLFGVWALVYGFYFNAKRFKQGGSVLMALAVIGLYANLGSLPAERYDPQEFSDFIARESERSKAEPPSRYAMLKAAADDVNASLPMMIDSNTRLDAAEALTGRFQYTYTLVSLSSAAAGGASLLEQIEAEAVARACSSSENMSFLKTGAIIDFIYKAGDGVDFVTVSVAPEDCE
jgi:hypothetical protein